MEKSITNVLLSLPKFLFQQLMAFWTDGYPRPEGNSTEERPTFRIIVLLIPVFFAGMFLFIFSCIYYLLLFCAILVLLPLYLIYLIVNKLAPIQVSRLKQQIVPIVSFDFLRAELSKRDAETRALFTKQQEDQGLYLFKDFEGHEYWGKKKDVEAWQKIDHNMKNNFSDMHHFDFEEFVGELFERMGYAVTVTPKTVDYGVDLVAKIDKDVVAVQVKRYTYGNNVGDRDVQKLLGAAWKYKANKSILVTTTDFTRQAYEQAKEAPIELWDKNYLYGLIRKYMLPTSETKLKTSKS